MENVKLKPEIARLQDADSDTQAIDWATDTLDNKNHDSASEATDWLDTLEYCDPRRRWVSFALAIRRACV